MHAHACLHLCRVQKVMVAAQEEQQGIRPSDSDIDPNSFLPGGLRALVLSVSGGTGVFKGDASAKCELGEGCEGGGRSEG